MATIKDVAKLAGVSVSTVSNILNHKLYVSDEKYNRVMDAIEKLQYNPSYLASNLRSKRTNNIIVILPELNSFYGQILNGITRVLEYQGYSVIVKLTDYSPYTERIHLTNLLNMSVSGVLVVCSTASDQKLYESILSRQIPIVSLCNEITNCDVPSVVFDNQRLVADLSKYLVEKKHAESLILLTGALDQSENADYAKSFERTMNNFGLDAKIYSISQPREKSIVTLIDILNELPEMPNCFISTNDDITNGLLATFPHSKKDLEIYSFSGDDLYNQPSDNVTLIHRSTTLLGQKAADLLLEYIKSPLFFESRREVISETKQYHENLSWSIPTARKKLHLLLVQSEATKAALKTITRFSEQYHIDISYDWMEYSEIYSLLLNQGSFPTDKYDIFMIDYPWLSQFCNDTVLLDMHPFVLDDNDDFLDSFFSIAQTEFIRYNSPNPASQIYVIPLLTTMQFLFYRRDLFEDNDMKWRFYKKHGVELHLPRSWAEFDVIARFFTQSFNPQSPVEYGTTFSCAIPINMSEEFFPRQWSYKGSIASSQGIVKWISPENRRTLASLKNAYLCSPASKDTNNTKARNILDGNLAMCMTYATHIPNAINTDLKNKIDFSNILSTKVPGNCPLFGGWSLGINKHSKNPFESYMLIKWVTSNQNAILNTLLGGFVPKQVIAENTYIKKAYPWMNTIQKEFDTAQKRRNLRSVSGAMIDSSVVDFILHKNITKYLKDEWTVDETLAAFQAEFEDLLL